MQEILKYLSSVFTNFFLLLLSWQFLFDKLWNFILYYNTWVVLSHMFSIWCSKSNYTFVSSID